MLESFIFFGIYIFIALAFLIGGVVLITIFFKENKKIDKCCSKCNIEVYSTQKYCRACGNVLHQNFNKGKRDFSLIFGIMLILQGVGCFVYFFIIFLCLILAI